jgi:hypothetical protein
MWRSGKFEREKARWRYEIISNKWKRAQHKHNLWFVGRRGGCHSNFYPKNRILATELKWDK